jgi:hypothetical protein
MQFAAAKQASTCILQAWRRKLATRRLRERLRRPVFRLDPCPNGVGTPLAKIQGGLENQTKGNIMKTTLQNPQRWLRCLVLCLIATAQAGIAREMTAFQLMKEGNRYVGEDSKDKVVQVRSEKSVGSVTPNIWYIVYYDPDASFKAVEVKFGAGQKMDVKRATRLLELVKADEPLAKERLKVDSDSALDIASKEPLLEKLTLKASRLILERRSLEDSSPVWKVRLWAAKLKNPNDNTDVGEVIISAEDGKVIKSELKPDRVD